MEINFANNIELFVVIVFPGRAECIMYLQIRSRVAVRPFAAPVSKSQQLNCAWVNSGEARRDVQTRRANECSRNGPFVAPSRGLE